MGKGNSIVIKKERLGFATIYTEGNIDSQVDMVVNKIFEVIQ